MSVSYLTAQQPAGLPAVVRRVKDIVGLSGRGPAADIALEHLSTGGKHFRARLALAAGNVLGADSAALIGAATACELLHNATLIHDDIQDGDLVRRGQPAVWARHGTPQAINAGDLLLMLPFSAVQRLDDPACSGLMSAAIARRAARTVLGQSAEMTMLAREELSWSAYLHAILGKTGALIALPVELAALAAGLDPFTAGQLGDEALGLGVLFQLQDDIVDLYGDKGRDRPGNDLREGKVSALVVAHVHEHPEDRGFLLDVLRTPRDHTRDEDVAELIHRFATRGALARVANRVEAICASMETTPAFDEYEELREIMLAVTQHALAPIATAMHRVTNE